jgi:hypothetical protein
MVDVIYKGRVVGREPPYTEEEEFELYKAMSYKNGAVIVRGSPRGSGISPASPPSAPTPPEAKAVVDVPASPPGEKP